jgi:outer membrane protein OmpA-like peptidoglycan-associated protein
MKRLLCRFIAITIFTFISFYSNAQLKKIIKHAKDKTAEKVNNGIDKAVDNSGNNSNSPNQNNANNNTADNSTASQTSTQTTNETQTTQPATPSVKSYQNYDFVPGDTVLFVDDFTEDQDGEFPSHWNLEKGQAVVNKLNGIPAFYLTEGNYAVVHPLMKTKNYLNNLFTVEFDYYPTSGSYGPILFFKYMNSDGNEQDGNIQFDTHGGVNTGYFPNDLNGSYPEKDEDAFYNKWHHAAMIYKNGQIKCYVDQYRVLVMPNSQIVPTAFGFEGIGDQDNPIIITNVRAAAGGNMNMIGKKFTESKIITHGITFDIDQSTLKPESMGTLNMIAGVLKSNPDLKFEIDGHTDNTGSAEHNMTLSQQRADAVKAQLLSMGIDASRLTTKGFGDTKPIDTNDTPSGKANNRRVEFVKM